MQRVSGFLSLTASICVNRFPLLDIQTFMMSMDSSIETPAHGFFSSLLDLEASRCLRALENK